ncbi:MAG: hypothetical protein KKF44_07340 [Nanoarchaeota archaeon]|nr:hypothetical protein [Nanoarchaeota archaeon]
MDYDFGYEELILNCIICGKSVAQLVYPGFDKEGYVCPRCNAGDLGDLSEDMD